MSTLPEREMRIIRQIIDFAEKELNHFNDEDIPTPPDEKIMFKLLSDAKRLWVEVQALKSEVVWINKELTRIKDMDYAGRIQYERSKRMLKEEKQG